MLSLVAVIGLIMGASVIESFGWHATFLLIIPITIMLFVLIKKYVILKENETLHTFSNKSSVHARKDILLSENTIQGNSKSEDYQSREKEKLSFHSINLKGAITLSITAVLFLILLQFLEKKSSFIYLYKILYLHQYLYSR